MGKSQVEVKFDFYITFTVRLHEFSLLQSRTPEERPDLGMATNVAVRTCFRIVYPLFVSTWAGGSTDHMSALTSLTSGEGCIIVSDIVDASTVVDPAH